MKNTNKGDSFGFKKEKTFPEKPKGIEGIKDIEKGKKKSPKTAISDIPEPPLPDITVPEPKP